MGAENALMSYNFNVAQPDIGGIINNSLNQKAKSQEIQMNQNMMNEYPEIKKDRERQRAFKRKMDTLQLDDEYKSRAMGALLTINPDSPPEQYKEQVRGAARVLGQSMMELGGFEPDEINMALGPMLEIYANNPEALRALQAEAGKKKDKTSQSMSEKEHKYYLTLDEKGRNEFLNLKRAAKTMDLGDKQIVLDPTDPTRQSASFQQGLAPEKEIPYLQESAEKEKSASGIADVNIKQYEAYTAASDNIAKIDNLINHIQTSDAITGLGATVFKNIERTKTLLGSKAAEGKVTDTELLDVMMGSEVFPMIKSLGVGAQGMDTPAEREFMRKVLTGEISLNKNTLLEMANIRKSVAQRAVDRWKTRSASGELDNFFNSTGIKKPSSSGGTAPSAAIEYLRNNPGMKEQFKQKYGYIPEGL